ncbi:acyltransferase family protein [Vulcanococcus limneticus]|uniref:acyltransferase family protein n=1 Tax=Vulcanococcus limneticus TaxID=2170428 RepID=UPI00398BCFDC
MSGQDRVASSKNQANHGYRKDIDGLRALAVLAVIVNHFNNRLLPSGYLGVDVFFVISGFVILTSLASRPDESFGDMFIGFYSRRVKRLLPALTFCLLVTAFLLCLLTPDPGLALGTARRALFGVSNFQLFADSVQYFGDSVALNPFMHTWSLGVEEQFYLVLPVLVGLSGFARSGTRGSRNLGFMIGVLSALSLLAFIVVYPKNQPAAYFLVPFRFWEMGSGCLLYILFARFQAQPFLSSFSGPISLLSLVSLAITFLMPLDLAVPATLLAVVATFVLMLSVKQGSAAYRLLTLKALVPIGLASYSLYLWHWPIISLSHLSVGIHWWTVPFQVLVIVGLAYISFRYVETPLRKIQWFPGNLGTVAIGIGGLIAAFFLLLFLGRAWGQDLYLGRFHRRDFVYVQDGMTCELMSTNADHRGWRACLQRTSEAPHIFVLGNSHASNLVPSLKSASQRLGYGDVRYLTNAIKHPYHTKETAPAAKFWNGSDDYARFIGQLRRDDIVVFSHSAIPEDVPLSDLRNQLSRLIGDVQAVGSRLILVDDIPRTCKAEDFKRSFLLTGGRGCRTDKQVALAYRSSLTQLLKEASKDKPLLLYLDPFHELCAKDGCYPTLNGQILYSDEASHFSKSNPAPLANFFLRHLPVAAQERLKG